MAEIAISEKKQNRTIAWMNTGMPCAYRRHKGGERKVSRIPACMREILQKPQIRAAAWFV